MKDSPASPDTAPDREFFLLVNHQRTLYDDILNGVGSSSGTIGRSEQVVRMPCLIWSTALENMRMEEAIGAAISRRLLHQAPEGTRSTVHPRCYPPRFSPAWAGF